MLSSRPIVAFIPTTDFDRARRFYRDTLGLKLVSEDGFALVFDANGIMLRVAKVGKYTPAQFTILGWEVDDINAALDGLVQSGVTFEHYNIPNQDDRGVWSVSGAKVAWFKDPDGNVLGISQHE
jgi:catechol 2,3-dioxygenase-like lactoylglutathione lyase family enzyme